MGRKVIVAAGSLNQWAMDFLGNMKRIIESIKLAKSFGARFRSGQELEIPGYSCGDHFLENDTFQHSWEVLAKIMMDPDCTDILCAVGMPVMHKNVAFTCQVFFLNKKVVLIRPKMTMCDDGNYRETRWFNAWSKVKQTEDFQLPMLIWEITHQRTVPIGDAVIRTLDTCVAAEICEEMWVPNSRHIDLSLDGVEIIANSSASYHQLRKVYRRIDLLQSASFKAGGVFMFSNGIGCDGERVFWDGGAMIYLNGKCVAQGPQFTLQEVSVTTAVVDLDDVQVYRNGVRSRGKQAAATEKFPTISIEFSLGLQGEYSFFSESRSEDFRKLIAVEEIRLGPAIWLWDYLRRSGQGGFFLPLSGGIDSSSTACVVASMCHLICEAIQNGNESVLTDVRKITGMDSYVPNDPNELASQLFTTCYMGSENSSQDTRNRAQQLAQQIGSYHFGVVIDKAVDALLFIFNTAFNKKPRFKAHNGSPRENLALQNVQARVRMVLSYLFAQLSQWARGRPGGLLVLGSANVDESLRGYLTKYDCSSADINPIGGISKTDLRDFIRHCHDLYKYPALESIHSAPPTAELEPLENGAITQTDEEDMGMTYEELSTYGKLRKQYYCGPYSMFCKLLDISSDKHPPGKIAEKVRLFFYNYSINRHKMTVLTPSYHCESYSPDDNRFDQRQFLYNVRWHWQNARIKAEVTRVTRVLEKMREERESKELFQDGSGSMTDDSKYGLTLAQPQQAYEIVGSSNILTAGQPQGMDATSSMYGAGATPLPRMDQSGSGQGQFIVVAKDPHKRNQTDNMEMVGDMRSPSLTKKPRDQVKMEAK